MVWLRLTLILNHPEQEDRMYDNMVVVLENSHRLRNPQKYIRSPSHPCQKNSMDLCRRKSYNSPALDMLVYGVIACKRNSFMYRLKLRIFF